MRGVSLCRTRAGLDGLKIGQLELAVVRATGLCCRFVSEVMASITLEPVLGGIRRRCHRAGRPEPDAHARCRPVVAGEAAGPLARWAGRS